jgi:formate hydrogenlyase subunit 3/multisubunit Na+/H+ antiporter MnhD subunit
MSPDPLPFLIIAAVALVLVVMVAPTQATRSTLMVRGAGGLAGMVAIALVPTLDLALLVVLALAAVQAALPGSRQLATRLRAPVLAVALLALALLFVRVSGPELLARFAAIGIVAGLAAGVGLLPYMHEFDPDEPVTVSPVAWMAFIGPVFAAVVLSRARGLVAAEAGVLGAMLIGLGLVNMVWGSVAAWRTESSVAAWRYSFMADWGLALCGFGLAVTDGEAGALLILFSVMLGRLPLYIASRPALREKTATDRPINLIAAALLAGSAPFAGFAARVLLLRGATELFWPLALALALAMLLSLPGSLRLGRSLGITRGRQALAVGIVVAINALIGLYPQPILRLVGL